MLPIILLHNIARKAAEKHEKRNVLWLQADIQSGNVLYDADQVTDTYPC